MTQIKPNGGELIPCSAAVTQLLFFLYLAAAVASLGALHCLEPCCFAEPGSGYLCQKAARNYSWMFFTGLLWALELLKPFVPMIYPTTHFNCCNLNRKRHWLKNSWMWHNLVPTETGLLSPSLSLAWFCFKVVRGHCWSREYSKTLKNWILIFRSRFYSNGLLCGLRKVNIGQSYFDFPLKHICFGIVENPSKKTLCLSTRFSSGGQYGWLV